MAFYIDGNQVDRFEGLIKAIEETTNVKTVEIAGSELPETHAIKLGNTLGRNQHLKSVKLRIHTHIKNSIHALFIPLLRRITSLTLTRTRLDDRAIASLSIALSNNETLEVLELIDVDLAGDISLLATAINRCTTLKTLDFSQTGDIGILARALAENTSITTLKLNNCKLEDDVGMLDVLLLNNVILTHLELRFNDITSNGLARLVPALLANTSLKSLDMESNRIETEGVVALAGVLEANTALETLNIGKNMIDDFTALGVGLRKNTILRELNMARNVPRDGNTASFALALGFNNGLQKLDLSDNLGFHTVALATGLSTNTTLQELNLSGCNVSWAGCRELGPVLAQNKTLTTLNLSDNVGLSVSTLLVGVIHLQTLLLNNCHLGDSDLRQIIWCLTTNTTLRSLNIARLHAGNHSWVPFIEILVHSQLTHCNLSGCDVRVQLLADLLKQNKTLVSLDISDDNINISANEINDDNVHLIADALKTNNTLQILELGNWTLTNNCLPILEGVFRYNTTLQVLDLNINTPALQEFDVKNNIDDDTVLRQIKQHLQRNKMMASDEMDTKPARAIALGPQPPF